MDVLTNDQSESPVLISNREVMELLKDKITARLEWEQKQQHKRFNKNSQNDKFRHRDWIEEHVHAYLQTTPCVGLASTEQMMELKSKLLARNPKKLQSSSPPSATNQQTQTPTMSGTTTATTTPLAKEEPSASTVPSTTPSTATTSSSTTTPRTGFGLTEAEAIQLLNFMPTEPVEIHLMIEELHARMSEDQQEELLALIQSYDTTTTTTIAMTPTTNRIPATDMEVMENGGGGGGGTTIATSNGTSTHHGDDNMEIVEEDDEEEATTQQEQHPSRGLVNGGRGGRLVAVKDEA
jgi:hypothetical protein